MIVDDAILEGPLLQLLLRGRDVLPLHCLPPPDAQDGRTGFLRNLDLGPIDSTLSLLWLEMEKLVFRQERETDVPRDI